jgi:hypothetical protein
MDTLFSSETLEQMKSKELKAEKKMKNSEKKEKPNTNKEKKKVKQPTVPVINNPINATNTMRIDHMFKKLSNK